jgi:hypothetical protein
MAKITTDEGENLDGIGECGNAAQIQLFKVENVYALQKAEDLHTIQTS